MKTAVHMDVAINGIYIYITLIEIISHNGNSNFMENFASLQILATDL